MVWYSIYELQESGGEAHLKRTEHLKDFFAKYWWRYVLGILTLIIVDALQLVVPKILGNVTDALREGSLTPEGLKKNMFSLFLQ